MASAEDMIYILPCNRPEFRQSVPKGEGWRLARDGETLHPGGLNWYNDASREHVLVPAIWYNLPASDYAKGLRFYAESNDECAAFKDREGKPWSAGDAARNRQQAKRLRAMAMLCDRLPGSPAGSIDFRGLSDPSKSYQEVFGL